MENVIKMKIKLSKNFKKTLAITIITVLLSVALIPAVNSTNISTNNTGNIQATAGDTDYYAVIAACSKYMDSSNNLPISTFNLKALNRALVQANLDLENKNDWNIKCLINQDATKDAILDALDWAASNVGNNDVFLFSWQGHGSEVKDTNGDESGLLDRYDEVICPYDCYRDYNERGNPLKNYITDDTLGQKFDAIQAKGTKGMLIMFESCLSGGMIDDTALSTIDGNGNGAIEQHEAKEYNNALKSDFISDDLGDPNGPGRMVIVSTVSDFGTTLGRGSYIFGFTMTWTMAHALKKGIFGPAKDKDNDGWISANEAFSWSRPRIILENSFFWITVWSVFFIQHYEYAKSVNENPNPFNAALNATLWTMFEFVYVQVLTRLSTGHFMFNWPNKKDNLYEKLPLIKINPLGGKPDQEDLDVPAIPESLWTMNPSYEELSDTFKNLVTKEEYNKVGWATEDMANSDVDILGSYKKNGKTIEFLGEVINGESEYTYSWDFDSDGTVDSSDQNPTYTYDEKGTYTATLTVTDQLSGDEASVQLQLKAGGKAKALNIMLQKYTEKFPLLKQLLNLGLFRNLI